MSDLKLINVTYIENEDWNFRGADTKYLTHGLHVYPARMIPQIARRLLEKYAKPGDLVLDPFCGSGTVLVESRLHGMNSIGVDINPLACLLAKVKSTPIDPKILRDYWEDLKRKIGRDIEQLRFGALDIDVPKFYGVNMNYWFKPLTMKELTVIRNYLMEIKDDEIRMFFEVPFSSTIREVSGVRKGEYKLYRIAENEWKHFLPNTFEVFTKNVENAIHRMEEYYRVCDKNVFSKVFMADTRRMFTKMFPEDANILLDGKVKIIVTSPPYGDSRTTVAYGQFSRLSSLWLMFEKSFDFRTVVRVDETSLGGNPRNLRKLNLASLNQTLELIEKSDKERTLDVLAFFSDLYTSLENMYRALDRGGYCSIVIANRTVRRVQIPTHAIIAEMGVEIGFENNITIIPRDIPTKRLPWENAPENIHGLKGKTMSKENIVIMRKPT